MKALDVYHSKREFSHTSEPKGKAVKKKMPPIFVVQKHAARKLHYDFRLEMEGVLKSWAVPKGPSLDPKIKRLAIEVEDHPLEYAHFEGTIPKGQYGAGEVEIWDKGTYTPVDAKENLLKGHQKGKIAFILNGKKLKGEFVLVRTHSKNQWLLIKKKDDQAVQTKKDEIFGIKKKMPHHLFPMLASLIEKPFNDPQWIFEIKWDGFRALAEITSKKCLLYSRTFHSFADRFPSLMKELKQFKKSMILDGEIVVLDKKGHSNFQLLQNYSGEGILRYYVFDLLYYDGYDLRDLPLIERKNYLQKILKEVAPLSIVYTDHFEEKGVSFFQSAKKQQIEGIIAKHKQSVYISKRSTEWLKIKTSCEQEMIIGGFTVPRGGRKFFGALLVGFFQNNTLVYAGRVGGGFDDQSIKNVFKKLQPLTTPLSPFKKIPKELKNATWVKPQLICQVKFQEWTTEKRMRQPIFKGLREDKLPKEVNKEKPVKKVPQSIEGTNLEKIFWHKDKYTKGDLLQYYKKIFKYILPYLRGRPITMHRFPEGIEGKSFWQKEAPTFTPNWIRTFEVVHNDKSVNYLLINDQESLLYVVNLGSIELHPFASRIDHIDNPDYIVLDLDPEAISFKKVVEVAQEIHQLLEELKMPHYCKTSGKRGLHILIPLEEGYSFEQGEHFAYLIASIVCQKLPKITSLVRQPKQRQKKVYIDYLQNSRTKTVVAPYSVRPVLHAPVSTPLFWNEVTYQLDPSHFTIRTLPERLEKMDDPLKSFLKGKKVRIEKVLAHLEKFLSV